MQGTGPKRLEMMNMQMNIRDICRASQSMLLVLLEMMLLHLVQHLSVGSKLVLTTYRWRPFQWNNLAGLWWHLRLWSMQLQVSATVLLSWRADLMIKSMTLFWDCRGGKDHSFLGTTCRTKTSGSLVALQTISSCLCLGGLTNLLHDLLRIWWKPNTRSGCASNHLLGSGSWHHGLHRLTMLSWRARWQNWGISSFFIQLIHNWGEPWWAKLGPLLLKMSCRNPWGTVSLAKPWAQLWKGCQITTSLRNFWLQFATGDRCAQMRVLSINTCATCSKLDVGLQQVPLCWKLGPFSGTRLVLTLRARPLWSQAACEAWWTTCLPQRGNCHRRHQSLQTTSIRWNCSWERGTTVACRPSLASCSSVPTVVQDSETHPGQIRLACSFSSPLLLTWPWWRPTSVNTRRPLAKGRGSCCPLLHWVVALTHSAGVQNGVSLDSALGLTRCPFWCVQKTTMVKRGWADEWPLQKDPFGWRTSWLCWAWVLTRLQLTAFTHSRRRVCHGPQKLDHYLCRRDCGLCTMSLRKVAWPSPTPGMPWWGLSSSWDSLWSPSKAGFLTRTCPELTG